ncbi:MAG: hypothetical protein M5U26_18535 [Planctomycetota bacterium]|nr:hypothetical protein [Planctomycetota bacterium]
MSRRGNCIVPDCPNPVHAKGYCRRHYGQIWRRGMIYDTPPRDRREEGLKGDFHERLRSLERELRRAQQMYDIVVGFQGRLKWRREIEAVEAEVRKIRESQEKAEAVEASGKGHRKPELVAQAAGD